MAAAILELAGDRNERSRLGDAGRRRVVEHFALKQMVEKTEEIYHRVAERS